MAEQISYINKLRFDEKLKNSFVAKYLVNQRLVLLILLSIIGAGIASFIQIPRVLNPSINIPIVIVSTVLPGANPADVESLITVPVEDSVRGIENVKTVTSTSQDSVSSVSIEFNSGIDPDKAKSDVQSAVDTVSNLPTDAQKPNVIKVDFQRVPIWQFIVTNKSDLASLTQFSNALKTKLEDQATIDAADASGIEEQEIQILIKPEAVATYKLNPIQLSSAIKAAVGSFPSGTVKTDKNSFALSIDAAATTVDQLRETRIMVNNNPIALSDIATIYERSKPGQLPSYYASANITPQRGVTFSVYKRSSAKIDVATTDAKKVVTDLQNQYPGQFEVQTLLDSADQVNTQFRDLVRDLAITVVLIFIMLFIFLGLRQAIVASLAVPLTFLMTFAVMNITHIDFSFIAFFSLLLSLGLLVDDTIVVISAMTAYYRTGRFSPLETALLVWRDFVVAVFTTTITTVWAFLPLLLSSGIIGEFIKPIPIVVSTTLMASFFVAMFITMPFIIFLLHPNIPNRVSILLKIAGVGIILGIVYTLLPQNLVFLQLFVFIIFALIVYRVRGSLFKSVSDRTKNLQKQYKKNNISERLDQGVIHFGIFERRYHAILERILKTGSGRKKALAAVIIFSIFAYILVPTGLVVNEFFPKSTAEYLFVDLELPSGTNSDVTKSEVLDILPTLSKLPNVNYVSADLGKSANTGGFGGAASGGNLASFTIHLKDKDSKTHDSIELATELRKDFNTYQKGTITVVEESGGPPAGADLQIKLFGSDLKTLNSYSDKIIAYLKTQSGVVNPDKSIKSGTGKLVFVPDLQKVSDAGLTLDQLGLWLRLYASGFTLDSVKFPDTIHALSSKEKEDITLRYSGDIQSPEGIASIIIPTQNGDVPLSSLGSLQLASNPTLITREDGKRTLSVSASVEKGFPTTVLNQKLEKYADSLNLPQGYSWSTGGANEENNNSVTSILQAMLLSFLLIIITMVLQFRSFRKAIIVMLVIPLSIAGVFIVFALTQTPLSFPALIGILALFGIVVKNSILLVDKISQNEEAGLPFVTAITDAATSRLEPIALTSIVAIIGLIPVTLSDPIWRGLGGAIIAGLTFSGTIMLFFIPVVYFYWFRPKGVK